MQTSFVRTEACEEDQCLAPPAMHIPTGSIPRASKNTCTDTEMQLKEAIRILTNSASMFQNIPFQQSCNKHTVITTLKPCAVVPTGRAAGCSPRVGCCSPAREHLLAPQSINACMAPTQQGALSRAQVGDRQPELCVST